MVPRVMKEAWAEDDDELGWAGLAGWGRTCRRGRLQTEPTAHVRRCITVLGPACTALPNQQTLEYTGTAGFPAARPARPNRLQSMGPGLGSMGPRHSLGNLQSRSSLNETDETVTVPMEGLEGTRNRGRRDQADPHSQAIRLLPDHCDMTTPRPKLEAARLGSDWIL